MARLVGACAIAALLTVPGCNRGAGEGAEPSRPGPEPSGGESPVSSGPSADAHGGPAAARIVFIDEQEACPCARRRIDGTWAALEAAMGTGSAIPVERIHRDTQEQEAEQYRLLRPMVTVPGIYVLDQAGALIELLQGELTEEQIRQALGAGAGRASPTSHRP